ncbi:MAG TPA: hypothetical protein VH518_17615 [Tepidisphaeraceae bacterium]|jgi:hypothetical protein
MANSYIPRSQAKAVVWFRTFANGISSNPSKYMLSPAEAAHISNVVDAFEASLLVATTPGTRTAVTVVAKDDARAAAEQLCQAYYSLIKHNAGVSDDDKIAIGVRPLNRGRTRINCPLTSPAVNVIAATPGRHVLRYRDSLTPSSKAKPFGAIALQLFVAVGDSIVRGVSEAKFCGSYTTNPVSVEFQQIQDGQVATYFGRWTSRRGEVGPWSLPASMRIAA